MYKFTFVSLAILYFRCIYKTSRIVQVLIIIVIIIIVFYLTF